MYDFRELRAGTTVSDFSLKEDISHCSDETIYKKIREKMRWCSVTIVLIGKRTGHRVWIDREIWASLRRYNHPYDPRKSFKPNGLLGIYLPEDSHSVPDRLQDNIDSKYAVTMHWDQIYKQLDKKINQAYQNREKQYLIDNGREKLTKNYWDILGIRI